MLESHEELPTWTLTIFSGWKSQATSLPSGCHEYSPAILSSSSSLGPPYILRPFLCYLPGKGPSSVTWRDHYERVNEEGARLFSQGVLSASKVNLEFLERSGDIQSPGMSFLNLTLIVNIWLIKSVSNCVHLWREQILIGFMQTNILLWE